MTTEAQVIASNRDAWNASADQHRNSPAWRTLMDTVGHPDFSCLDPTLTGVLNQIGLDGKAVAQLGCNNGRESLSLFALGAHSVVGVDQSSAFLEQAHELTARSPYAPDFVEADIHQLPTGKLHEIFGADAGLYVTVSDYGTRYMILSSATIVTANAKLVDLKTGATLWTGSATASSEEGRQNQGGLIGMLVAAAVNQIISSVQDDAGYPIAGITSARLLSPGPNGGILYGPRSPKYGTD